LKIIAPIAGYDGYWSLDNTTNDLSGNSYNVQSGTVSFQRMVKKERILLLSMEVQIIFNIVMVLF
jgi:hypothetical protein